MTEQGTSTPARLKAALRAVLRRLPGHGHLFEAWHLATNPLHRQLRHIERHRAGEVFQIGGRTAFDRYPTLFAALRDQLEAHPAPRIVSFGCSSGDELLSLRHYLPRARLVGVDINAASVRRARSRTRRDPAVQVVQASAIATAAVGLVDAVVCLSVLQHSVLNHQAPDCCLPHASFERYEAAVRDFDASLAVGGLLLLYHSNFNFMETSVACRYRPLLVADPLSPSPRRLYGANNLLALQPRSERFALYRKMAG